MRIPCIAVVLLAAHPAFAEDPCGPAPPSEPAAEKPPAAGRVRLRGVIRGSTDVLPGATIVAERGDGTEAAITDEHGVYYVDVVPGTYKVLVYYAEQTITIAENITVTGDTSFGTTFVDETKGPPCCIDDFGNHESPELTSYPRHGIAISRGAYVVSRDRTARAWIAPAAAADPESSVTTLGGAPRFLRAPAVPIAFVQDVSTFTMRAPITTATGSGGASDVTLRAGSNELSGSGRAYVGADRVAGDNSMLGGGELVAAGSLKQDKAWFAAGLVGARGTDGVIDTAGLLRLDYAHEVEHQLGVTALAQQHGNDLRDGWADAHWTSKLDDAKLVIEAHATAEQLVLPDPAHALADNTVTNRAGGELAVTDRMKLYGHHALHLSLRAGVGRRGEDRHTDLAVAAGDEWQLQPNIQVEAGVRADRRTLGSEDATVTSPRVAASWDWTKEGRAELFVAYQRVPHLDDGMPGDWASSPALFHDELALGAAYLPSFEHAPMAGFATRVRRTAGSDEAGVEGWIRYDVRTTTIHASATTFGKVATLLAQHRVFDRDHLRLLAATTIRLSPDVKEGGGALQFLRSGTRASHQPDLDVAVEGYGGTAGPGARLLLGVTW